MGAGLGGQLVDFSNNLPKVVSLAVINSYFSALILKEYWDALIIQASCLAMVVQHDGGEEYAQELKSLVDHGDAQLLAAAQGKPDDGGECLAHLIRILKVVVESQEPTLNEGFISQVTGPVQTLCATIKNFTQGHYTQDNVAEAREFTLNGASDLGKLKRKLENELIERHAVMEVNFSEFLSAYADLITWCSEYAEQLDH